MMRRMTAVDGVTPATGIAKTGADWVPGGRGGEVWLEEFCGWMAEAGLAALGTKEQDWLVPVISPLQ